MQTFTSLLFILPIVCVMGHAHAQDTYTGEFSLNIPADAGFGNNFHLVTFPDHAPQTQQAQQYDVSLLQQQRLHEQQQQQLLLQQQQQQQLLQAQQQQQAEQRLQSQAQPQRFQPAKPQGFQQSIEPQRFQETSQAQRFESSVQPQIFQQSAQPQRFQQSFKPQRFQAVPQPQVQQQMQPQTQAPNRPSSDVGRFSESRRPEPRQGGFSNFPARTPARASASGDNTSSFTVRPTVPAFKPSPAAPPVVPAFRFSPTASPVQASVEPESTVVDFDYDPELSRFQLFKLRQKAKLAAQEAQKKKKTKKGNRIFVKVVKRKKTQG